MPAAGARLDRPWPLTAPGGPSLLGRRPELLPIGAVVLAWTFLLLNRHGVGVDPSGDPSHFGLTGHSAPGPWAAAAAGTAVMTIAMMGLVAVPVVRRAARSSLWWRSGRSAAAAFAGFAAVWIGVAAGLQAVLSATVPPHADRIVAASLLVAAALIQLHPRRAALVRRCDLAQRIRPSGLRAVADCARCGAVFGVRCVRLCAVPMGAMLAAPTSLTLMAGLAAATLADRICAGRRAIPIAACYALFAAAALVQ